MKDKEIAGYLKTECGAKEICAGTLFPGEWHFFLQKSMVEIVLLLFFFEALARNFPNGVVSIKSRTSTHPSVHIEKGKATITLQSRIEANANVSEWCGGGGGSK